MMNPEKQCCLCREWKSVSLFSRCKSRKDGLQPRCKVCSSLATKRSKPAIDTESRKHFNEKRSRWRKSPAGKAATSKEIQKRTGDPRYLAKRRERYKTVEKARKNHREYVKKRRKEDVIYRLIGNLRSRNRSIAKKINNGIGSIGLVECLGCSLDEFKKHVENLFAPRMTWGNYGQWHLDHVKPLCIATSIEEVMLLNHYSNLQPLWGSDNIKKGKKWEN